MPPFLPFPIYRWRAMGAVKPQREFIMNRPGFALLCKKIPSEDTEHLDSVLSGVKERAGMVCEFFTYIAGHESPDTPGSMGDFAPNDDVPVAAADGVEAPKFRSIGSAF